MVRILPPACTLGFLSSNTNIGRFMTAKYGFVPVLFPGGVFRKQLCNALVIKP